ncbi:hypothetical protein OIU74_018822 [Salix koriyanagi]|uniref:Uncharacterized protein n=1 Tax=Salix koriyanagi TaxID=2511006 RepID=A0A9Q0WSF2_9ROSI|nr:hypothetical protein OIU74_018822 [Salix koriyanagi]
MMHERTRPSSSSEFQVPKALGLMSYVRFSLACGPRELSIQTWHMRPGPKAGLSGDIRIMTKDFSLLIRRRIECKLGKSWASALNAEFQIIAPIIDAITSDFLTPLSDDYSQNDPPINLQVSTD